MLSSGELRVLHGKGDRWRVVAVDPGATAYVERWLALRARLGVDAAAPVFCTTRNDGGGVGRPMRSSAVRQTLKRYARKAGIAKRVYPHGLRHTHAYELMKEGQPVALIQQQLGHIDLSMTQGYVNHLAPAARLRAGVAHRATGAGASETRVDRLARRADRVAVAELDHAGRQRADGTAGGCAGASWREQRQSVAAVAGRTGRRRWPGDAGAADARARRDQGADRPAGGQARARGADRQQRLSPRGRPAWARLARLAAGAAESPAHARGRAARSARACRRRRRTSRLRPAARAGRYHRARRPRLAGPRRA